MDGEIEIASETNINYKITASSEFVAKQMNYGSVVVEGESENNIPGLTSLVYSQSADMMSVGEKDEIDELSESLDNGLVGGMDEEQCAALLEQHLNLHREK